VESTMVPDGAPDLSSICQKVQELSDLLGIVLNLIKGINDRQDATEKVLLEDLIGGITREGTRIRRGQLDGEIRGKYGSLGKYGEAFKQLFDKDIFEDTIERVYPEMEKAKFADGKLDELMGSILGQLSTRFKGIVPDDEPESLKVEVEAAGEKPEMEEEELPDDLKKVTTPGLGKYLFNQRKGKGA
jgi:hypothetical protein